MVTVVCWCKGGWVRSQHVEYIYIPCNISISMLELQLLQLAIVG